MAGLHRVLGRLDVLRAARVIVVVAGMDGALPSVVAGLVAAPVVAVPTSVGYGAAFEGLARPARDAQQLRARGGGGQHRQRLRRGTWPLRSPPLDLQSGLRRGDVGVGLRDLVRGERAVLLLPLPHGGQPVLDPGMVLSRASHVRGERQAGRCGEPSKGCEHVFVDRQGHLLRRHPYTISEYGG